MKNLIFLLIALFILNGCNRPTDDSKEVAEEANEEQFDNKLEDDAEFAVDAADGGMLEVQLAELAMANGSSSQVKEFAQTMVSDHSKANEELKALAASKNIALPTALSEEKRRDYDDLSKKAGTEFDKAYCDYMVKDHKNDLDDFKKQAEKGNDPELRSWAAQKVPTLEHHLSMAESLKDALK